VQTARGKPPPSGAMLKQEELAFVKSTSKMELSPGPPPPRELRKPMAARKRSKNGAPSKAKTPCIADLKCHLPTSVARRAYQPSGKPSQHSAAKRKAEYLSSSDGSTGPASRRPAPEALAGLSAPGSASCKPLPGEDGQAYAAVVAWHANPQHPGGPPKPSAKGSDIFDAAASSEAATRRM
jgi:hypothetical protein